MAVSQRPLVLRRDLVRMFSEDRLVAVMEQLEHGEALRGSSGRVLRRLVRGVTGHTAIVGGRRSGRCVRDHASYRPPLNFSGGHRPSFLERFGWE